MSVVAAAGFQAAGVVAGLKASGALDVALVLNTGPHAVGAGVFTRNRVQAASVVWSRQVVRDGIVRAVLLNSGGANAVTGPQGFADVHTLAETVADRLDVSAGDVAVAQTGLIGVPSLMERLVPGVHAAAGQLSSEPRAGAAAAEAIRTTDSHRKEAVEQGAGGFTVGGMAKGAGMLAPSLATMLCVLTTDAVTDAETLDRVLRAAVATTFERVDADGCLSTNDTVLLLASGSSGVVPDPAELERCVHAVCDQLARQLVSDAEGASKDVLVTVTGATTEAAALEVARAIARNSLLKCALAGSDPNWGRVLAAAGTVSEDVAPFDPLQLSVTMNGVEVCRDSTPAADPASVDLSGREVAITLDLAAGPASAWLRTTDLTEAYVHENSAYST